MTTATNNLIRIGIILGITFCLFLGITQVKANTFTEVTAGYGYTPVVNGTAGSRSWVSYNSSNLVNYGYNLGDTNYYQIDEFNIRFRATGGFQRGTSYAVTFTWDNYHPTIDTNNFYADWLLMTHSLYCYSSSWSSSGQTGSNCFTSSNILAQQSGDNRIIVTLTFVPSADFYGFALVNQHGSTITNYKSIGWEVYEIGYSYSTDGSQDIINNANQNTQNIINNQDSNTQDIIDNQNQNTQDIQNTINDNFQSCRDSYNLMPVKDISLHRTNNRTINVNLNQTYSAGTYTFSYDYFSENNPIVRVQVILDGSGQQGSIELSNSGKSTITARNSFNRLYFYILIDSASDSSVTLSNIMLVSGSTPKDYEPYGQQVCVNKLDEQNNAINNINDSLTDTTPPDTSGLSNAAGWLPPGPVDSILNLPLTLLQSLNNAFSTGSCQPLVIHFPHIAREVPIPCMSTIWENFGLLPLFTWIGRVIGGILLYKYLINLYKWVDDTLTMRENNNFDDGSLG